MLTAVERNDIERLIDLAENLLNDIDDTQEIDPSYGRFIDSLEDAVMYGQDLLEGEEASQHEVS